MTILKVSSLLLAIYAVLFAIDSTLFAASSRGGAEWMRFFLFVPVALLLAWGLWKNNRWTWLGGLVFSLVFGVLQLGSLLLAHSFSFSQDLLFIVLRDGLLAAVFFLLLWDQYLMRAQK